MARKQASHYRQLTARTEERRTEERRTEERRTEERRITKRLQETLSNKEVQQNSQSKPHKYMFTVIKKQAQNLEMEKSTV